MPESAARLAGQLQERQPGDGILPVLPALRPLFPAGGLAKGSVVAVDRYGLLCLTLMAGASAAGAWCAVAGVPEFGVAAAADAGVEPARLLLVPDPGAGWPQVAASLLDGCEIVVVRPPAQPPAQVRQRLGAVLRRSAGVMLVIGEWDSAPVRLRVARQRWTGLGDGHGRLRACRAEVVAEGRGAAGRPRRERLWLPAPDGTVAAAGPEETMPGQPPVADGWRDELAGWSRFDVGAWPQNAFVQPSRPRPHSSSASSPARGRPQRAWPSRTGGSAAR